MPFPTTTRWALVDALKTGNEALRTDAFGELFSLYGPPLFAFARNQSHGLRNREDCEDLVNGFFLECLERGTLERADHTRGKFRNFLARSFKNYMLNEDRAGVTQKRHPPGGIVSLQALAEELGATLEPRSDETPEQAYDRVLRRSMFREVLNDFANQCRTSGQETKYWLFVLRDVKPRRDGIPTPTYDSLARRLGLSSANTANKLSLAGRKEFDALLFERVGRDCESVDETQAECALVVATALQPADDTSSSPVKCMGDIH